MSAPDPTEQPPTPARTPWWLVLVWGLLGLVLLGLLVMAVRLFFTSGFFGDGPVTAAESKNVWTFLGVSLGAVVTLIGTLLTFQHQQRTTELAREQQVLEATRHRDDRELSRQTERRLQVDTAAQMLEHLTREDGTYAEPAVVAGAVAAMMEVGGGTTGLRVLRRLWVDGHVDAATAVPAINRILLIARDAADTDTADSSDNSLNRPVRQAEVYAAAELLALQADSVLPASGDPQQSWLSWPSVFEKDNEPYWPRRLPLTAKNALLVFIARALVSRDEAWWAGASAQEPVNTLLKATWDPDVEQAAAALLLRLIDTGFAARVKASLGDGPDERANLERLADGLAAYPWFIAVIEAIPDAGTAAAVPDRAAAPPAAPGNRETDPSGAGSEQHPGVGGQA